jgi:hypothetical protein
MLTDRRGCVERSRRTKCYEGCLARITNTVAVVFAIDVGASNKQVGVVDYGGLGSEVDVEGAKIAWRRAAWAGDG